MRLSVIFFALIFLVTGVSAIGTSCESSMVSYWQLEGNVLDSYGSYDSGSGFPDLKSNWLVGDAAQFSGTQKISISDVGSELSLSSGSGFTIEFWFDSLNPNNGYLLKKGNYEIRYIVEPQGLGTVNKIVASVQDSTGAWVSVNATVDDNKHFVSLVWNSLATDRLLKLYVDGVSEDEVFLTSMKSSSDDLIMGEGFTGLMDEVAFYGAPLSSATIKKHYDLSLAGLDYCYAAGTGGSSGTRTDFSIAGCNEGGIVLEAGACSRDGKYYCGSTNNVLYDTVKDARACAFGKATYVAGTPQCCPGGGTMLCDENEDMKCFPRTESCVDKDSQTACLDAGCFWFDIDGNSQCLANPTDNACSAYSTKANCEVDIWNLGQMGIGTEVCGDYFKVGDKGYIIPASSCDCTWDAVAGECKLSYDVTVSIYGSVQDAFTCSKDYLSGACVDGSQHIEWTSSTSAKTGAFSSVVPSDVLTAAKCSGGEEERVCGQPVLRMPGFSFFALILSIGLIGLFYFFKKE